MIALILGIIKWILIFVLAVLGLSLFLIVILLLVPVRYWLYGSRSPGEGVLTADGKVSWLASILAVTFAYDREFSWKIQILGIPLKNKEDNTSDKESQPLTEDEEVLLTELETEMHAEPKIVTQAEIKNSTKTEPEFHEAESVVKSKVPLKEKVHEIRKKIQEVFHSIPVKTGEIRDKVVSLKQQSEIWMKFVKSEEVKQLIATCWKQIKRILRHLLPTSLKIRGNMGFADPAVTGKVIGFLYALPPRYQKGIQLQPHFQEECLDGEVALKGRIRLGSLLWPLLCILTKSYTWKVYKKHKALTKKTGSAGDTKNTKSKTIKNDPHEGGK